MTKKMKKDTRKNTKKEQSVGAKFSAAVTRKVIQLLREDGKMSAGEIANVIGKSRNTVYSMAQGKPRLSAEDYGNLVRSGSLPSSVLAALQDISKKDVRQAVDDAGKFAKDLYEKGSKEGIRLSKVAIETGTGLSKVAAAKGSELSKNVAKVTGKCLKRLGEFIEALGG